MRTSVITAVLEQVITSVTLYLEGILHKTCMIM